MRNITLTMDEDLIEKGKAYAQALGISFNALVRRLLEKQVVQESDWIEYCFEKMDEADGHSGGKPWNRDDLYDV